ncbi:MAG: peptide deformylase [Gemmatimonadota bacterium]
MTLLRRAGSRALAIGASWKRHLGDAELKRTSLERQLDLEGCLSLPGVAAYVPRSTHVTVRGTARTGHFVSFEAGGLLARILQHQIDHLDGILLWDHVPPLERSRLQRLVRQAPPSCSLPDRRVEVGPGDLSVHGREVPATTTA